MSVGPPPSSDADASNPAVRSAERAAPNVALAAFLRSRRARLRPDLRTGRRRVAGLRRAEVAQRAGVSTEYYRRVEQGRAGNVSDSILSSIAAALRLSPDERRYLVEVSHRGLAMRPPADEQVVPGALTEMLDALTLQPSIVVGRRTDLLASNALADVVFGDFRDRPPEERNVARFVFLDPAARERHVDWDSTARTIAAMLRRRAAEHPADERMAALIADLAAGSPEFRALWAVEGPGIRGDGRRHMQHPAVGRYHLTASTFTVPEDPEQTVVIHTAKRHSPSEAALRRLATHVRR